MIGWLFIRDLWPLLRPGEPPPFTIDLVDEAGGGVTFWKVSKNDTSAKNDKDNKNKRNEEFYTATTSVSLREERDTYELHCHIKPLPPTHGGLPPMSRTVTSTYEVTRDGELRKLDTSMVIRVEGREFATIGIKGSVDEGRFQARLSMRLADADSPKVSGHLFEPVDFPERGCVMNPLHPLNRLPGLREGQRWLMPLLTTPVALDLLADKLERSEDDQLWKLAETFLRLSTVSFLEAEVQRGTQSLDWKKQEVSCLLVECHGEEASGRIWVRKGDGLVLQQEVIIGTTRWLLERTGE